MLLCGWAETLDQLVALRALQGVGGWLVLPRSRDEDVKRDETFDLAGAVLLVPAVGLGVLALTQVSVWPLASPAMLGSVAASILFLVLFLRRERKTRWPVVDVELFRARLRRRFRWRGDGLCAALRHAVPDVLRLREGALLQRPRGAAVARHHPHPAGVGRAARHATRRTLRRAAGGRGRHGAVPGGDPRLVAIAFGPDRLVVRLVALAPFGAGLGPFLAPNSHATIDVAPKGHAASAGGLVDLGRVLGSCIGVSAASSTLSWRLGLSGGADRMGPAFVEAVAGSLFVLAAFAVVAIWRR